MCGRAAVTRPSTRPVPDPPRRRADRAGPRQPVGLKAITESASAEPSGEIAAHELALATWRARANVLRTTDREVRARARTPRGRERRREALRLGTEDDSEAADRVSARSRELPAAARADVLATSRRHVDRPARPCPVHADGEIAAPTNATPALPSRAPSAPPVSNRLAQRPARARAPRAPLVAWNSTASPAASVVARPACDHAPLPQLEHTSAHVSRIQRRSHAVRTGRLRSGL